MELPDFGVPQTKALVVNNETQKPEDDKSKPPKYPPFSLKPSSTSAGKFYYGLRIVNGAMQAAGTTGADVFFDLVGSKSTTGKVSIYSYFTMTFSGISAKTCNDMIVETDKDLGEVLVVLMGIDGGGLDTTWFVDYAVVKYIAEGVEAEFPCYHWIGKHQVVSTTSKTTTFKDIKGNEVLKRQRESQLKDKKKMYQWQKFPDSGLPSAIDDTVSDLPLDEEFSRVKKIDFTVDALKGMVSTAILGVMKNITRLADYIDFTTFLGGSQAIHVERDGRWCSDVEFGRQILNGVNPVIIRRCTEIPSKFPVTNEMVKPILTRGLTLQQEMEAGHIYICDLAVMDGLPTREGQYVAAPICLLYVNGCKQLVPMAIQLKQGVRDEEKGKPNPIFLACDNWNDWLLAKMFYQSAVSQHHQLSTHYQCCHASMEAYAVATKRNLPDAHPIYKLLLPHFRYTMAINSRARATLINDGGIIDKAFAIGTQGRNELVKRASKIFSVDWTNLKKSIKDRGVDDPDQLPGYHYRDDGLKVFNAIEDFVRDVVNAYYASDEDVKGDPELQNWADDIYTNAFPGFVGGKQGHDFPQEIASKELLIERCTVIIFTGSAQHTSINFGQYQIYGFVPNAPFSMRRPAPSVKGNSDHQTLLDTLPDEDTAKSSIGITYALSQYSPEEIYLGQFPYKRFTEANIQGYIERFQERLQEINGEIEVRNESIDVNYEYMLPSKIPNSITI